MMKLRHWFYTTFLILQLLFIGQYYFLLHSKSSTYYYYNTNNIISIFYVNNEKYDNNNDQSLSTYTNSQQQQQRLGKQQQQQQQIQSKNQQQPQHEKSQQQEQLNKDKQLFELMNSDRMIQNAVQDEHQQRQQNQQQQQQQNQQLLQLLDNNQDPKINISRRMVTKIPYNIMIATSGSNNNNGMIHQTITKLSTTEATTNHIDYNQMTGIQQVPREFYYDYIHYQMDYDTTTSNYQSNSRHRPFPRWESSSSSMTTGTSTASSKNTMIDTIIDYVQIQSITYESLRINNNDGTIMSFNYSNFDPIIHIKDHLDDVIWWEPEILYVISSSSSLSNNNNNNDIKIYMSETLYMYHLKVEKEKKIIPTNQMLSLAMKLFMSLSTSSVSSASSMSQTLWPTLYKTLILNKQSNIPLLLWYGDYTGCNNNNWDNTCYNITCYKRLVNEQQDEQTFLPNPQSLALFTVAGNVDCTKSFVLPNFQSYTDSKHNVQEWIDQMLLYQTKYPTLINKQKQIIWRGSLTGRIPIDESKRCIRYQTLKYIHNNISIEHGYQYYNVYMTSIPQYYHKGNISPNLINTTLLGNIQKNVYPMEEYQNYRAILDIDGNSWSSRFGKLLCYNSIILKIEPNYIDYFYNTNYDYGNVTMMKQQLEQQQTTTSNHNYIKKKHNILIPWKHYIPIKSDLSDLHIKVQYVMNDNNINHIQSIIHNANIWCQNHMLYNTLAYDTLHVLESYVYHLNQNNQNLNNQNWEDQWNQYQQSSSLLINSNGSLQMKPIV